MGMPRTFAISAVTLAPGKTPPLPGFAPWLSFTSMAFTFADWTVSTKRSMEKRPVFGARSEVACSKLVNEPGSVSVVIGDAALARVVEGPGSLTSAVDGFDRWRREAAVAHRRDHEHTVRPECLGTLPMAAHELRARQKMQVVLRLRRLYGESRVLQDQVVGRDLQVVVGSEAEVVVLLLRRRVDPGSLIAGERSFFVVVGDDVLPKLRPDHLEQVAEVPDDREVPQDRMLLLEDVVESDDAEDATDTDQPFHGGEDSRLLDR